MAISISTWECDPSPCEEDLVRVNPKIWLEGPYDANTGLMKDDLKPYLPDFEPYTGLGYSHSGPGGGEGILDVLLDITGAKSMVDYVIVELRDANDNTNIIATRTGVLLRDGSIVDVDGYSDLTFLGVVPGDYFLAIRHRNHLGIMTLNTVSLSKVPVCVDFRDGSVLTWGTDAQIIIGPNGEKSNDLCRCEWGWCSRCIGPR